MIANAADQRMGHIRSFQTGKHSIESQWLLNEISGARVCLLNPAKKAAYDEALRWHLASATTPSPKVSPPAAPTAEPDPCSTLDFYQGGPPKLAGENRASRFGCPWRGVCCLCF